MNRVHSRIHSIARLLSWACFTCIAVLAPLPAQAADPAPPTTVAVVGLFPNRALVQINGGPPRTLSINQKTAEGVVLLSVEKGSATFELNGRRQTLQLGQASASAGAVRSSVTLSADRLGHFRVIGQINGGTVSFIVDTGASLVSISSADAKRIGLNYLNGLPVATATANGTAEAYQVKLDTVKVGDISVSNVDALVLENQNMPVLLGMSFLNRMEMKRDGQSMTLTKKF